MKPSLALVTFFLPFTTLALYDESFQQKVKLEDIEDEHLRDEGQPKAVQLLHTPPPLSRQPAKGHPLKPQPSPTNDNNAEQQADNPPAFIYSALPHHFVQPLVDIPQVPQFGFQQVPSYYQPHMTLRQQTPFYYSHDLQQQNSQQPQPFSNYQFQFIPIGQKDGTNRQQAYTAPLISLPFTAPGANLATEKETSSETTHPQQQESSNNHDISNDIQRPDNINDVYNARALLNSQKDIEYAKPSSVYGPPTKTKDLSNYNSATASQSHYNIESDANPSDQNTEQNYEKPEHPSNYFGSQKDIEYAKPIPPTSYGSSNNVEHVPHAQYGVPEAPFRRPQFQSNQKAYAPQRSQNSAHSNDKLVANTLPYPPSFVSITTKAPQNKEITPTAEPQYNEPQQWQINVMPLHLIPPAEPSSQGRTTNPSSPTGKLVQHQSITPTIDLFLNRRSKSLLDSYIPSWLVPRLQEQHQRQFYQNYQQVIQDTLPPSSNVGYNTIAYSADYDDIYRNDKKRSVRSGKLHKKTDAIFTNKPTAIVKDLSPENTG